MWGAQGFDGGYNANVGARGSRFGETQVFGMRVRAPPPCPSLPPSGYRTGHYNVWHCWSFWTFYIFEALSLKSLKSRIETIWKQFVKPLEYVNGELLANNYKSCLKIIIIRSDQIHTWISEYTVYLFFFCFILSLQAKQWRTRTNYRPGLETKLGVPYFFLVQSYATFLFMASDLFVVNQQFSDF